MKLNFTDLRVVHGHNTFARNEKSSNAGFEAVKGTTTSILYKNFNKNPEHNFNPYITETVHFYFRINESEEPVTETTMKIRNFNIDNHDIATIEIMPDNEKCYVCIKTHIDSFERDQLKQIKIDAIVDFDIQFDDID